MSLTVWLLEIQEILQESSVSEYVISKGNGVAAKPSFHPGPKDENP